MYQVSWTRRILHFWNWTMLAKAPTRRSTTRTNTTSFPKISNNICKQHNRTTYLTAATIWWSSNNSNRRHCPSSNHNWTWCHWTRTMNLGKNQRTWILHSDHIRIPPCPQLRTQNGLHTTRTTFLSTTRTRPPRRHPTISTHNNFCMDTTRRPHHLVHGC